MKVTVEFDDALSQDIINYAKWVGLSVEKIVSSNVKVKFRQFNEQRLAFVYFDENNDRQVVYKEIDEPIPEPPFCLTVEE